MATFDSIFPTFLAKCGELHTLLLSVAFALFIVGIIVTVFRKFTHRAALDLLLRLLLLTSLLVFLPAWGNTLQNLLQTSILSGLGVDPANVYQQFNQLLIIKRDPATTSSWWNVMSQLHNFTTDLIISAVLWLVGQFASLMMFWAYIFQTIILNLGYALSPLLIGFMAIPALKHTGNRYLMNLVGVLLWPLGWALAALVTQGILDFMTDPSFEYIDPTSTLPDLQKTIGVAVVGFWIIFSTVAAPVIIQNVIAHGIQPGGALLAGGVSSFLQTAATTAGAAATASSTGIPAVTAGAAGVAALLSTMSSAANITDGSAGLRGEVIKSDNFADIKLFAATFLSGAAGALTEKQQTIFGPVNSPTLNNAPFAGAQAVLQTYAQQILDSIQKDGFYVRVPSGKQFYLYVLQTIDAADASLGGTAIPVTEEKDEQPPTKSRP